MLNEKKKIQLNKINPEGRRLDVVGDAQWRARMT